MNQRQSNNYVQHVGSIQAQGTLGPSVVAQWDSPNQCKGIASPVPVMTAVDRLVDLRNTGISGNEPEPERDYVLGTTATSMREFESQLSALRREIDSLTSYIRPYLPDSMYSSGGCEGVSISYEAAGNLDSPALRAYAELLNTIVDIRTDIRRIANNIVV